MNEENKTILYVGGFELPDKNAAAQRVIANAKIFKKLGYNVIFIGVSKGIDYKEHISDIGSINGEFVYYSIPYPRNLLSWGKYLTDIPYFKKIKEINPKIIIAYNYPALALNRLINHCKTCNIKIIADITEWHQPYGNWINNLLKNMDTTYRMKFIHKKMDGLITISRFLHNYYKSSVPHIIEVPPLVDLSMEKWKMKDIYSVQNNVIQLIYAGLPGKNKDRLDIITKITYRVIKEYDKKLILKIVGINREQFIETYSLDENIIQDLDDFVEFKGRMSHLDAIQEVSNCDFQIFIREKNLVNTAGFPTKFVESLSCGTPVITNLSSNLENYLRDGFNGIILDLENEEKLFSSFSKIISLDRVKIDNMKENCRNTRNFDYHNYIGLFETFFYNIIRS